MAHLVKPVESFLELIQPLIGLPVALAWKGYGSTIFLELGQLQPLQSERQYQPDGEACISVDWDWRVEDDTAVLYGSSCSGPEINKGIATLQNTKVQGLSLAGKIPELVIHFSNGQCLRSMYMVKGDPQWSIRLVDNNWMGISAGKLAVGDGTAEFTEQEDEPFALEKKAALRWGVPLAEPAGGQCRNCAWHIPLDGDAYLLDYGVCAESASPLDGRVVNVKSGCASFTPMEKG